MVKEAKPKPCVGCGYCCILSPCVYSLAKYGELDCPALAWDGQRYRCGEAKEWGKQLGIGAGCCCSCLNLWRHDVRERRRPTPRERGLVTMGVYLDGSTDGRARLPQIGKADALIQHYEAKEVDPEIGQRILQADYPVPDEGPVLVIVVRRNPYFDAALYVDEPEHAYLRKYPGELSGNPMDKKPLRYLLVPRRFADPLCGHRARTKKKEPEKIEQESEQLTPLQQNERKAMVGDTAAALRCVNALRRYRAIVTKTLNTRYRDGETDASQLFELEQEQALIEQLEQPS